MDKVINIILNHKSEGSEKAAADSRKLYEQSQQFAQQELTTQQKVAAEIKSVTDNIRQLEEAKKKAYTVNEVSTFNNELKVQNVNLKLLKNQLNDISGAVGQFKNKVSGALDSLGSGFKNLLLFGGIAGLAFKAGQAIEEFVKSSILEFAKLQQSEERLGFALREVAKEGDNVKDRLIKQANDIQKAYGYKRQELIESTTDLVTRFNLSGEEAGKLMKRIADTAAATGDSIETVTEKYGLALEGNARGMKRYGVILKDTGTEQGNLNEILKGTSKFVGEAAENMETLSGKMRMYQADIETAKQNTGGWLKDFSDGIIDVSEQLLVAIGLEDEALLANKEKLADLKQYMESKQGQFDAELDMFDKLTDAQKKQDIATDNLAQKSFKNSLAEAQAQKKKLEALREEEPLNFIKNDESDPKSPYYKIGQRIEQQYKLVDSIQKEVYYTGELIKQKQISTEKRSPTDTKGTPAKSLKDTKDFEDLKDELMLASEKDLHKKEIDEVILSDDKKKMQAEKTFKENIKALEENFKNKLITQAQLNEQLKDNEKKYNEELLGIDTLGADKIGQLLDKFRKEQLEKDQKYLEERIDIGKGFIDNEVVKGHEDNKERYYKAEQELKKSLDKKKISQQEYTDSLKILKDREILDDAKGDQIELVNKIMLDRQKMESDRITKKQLGTWTDKDEQAFKLAIAQQSEAIRAGAFKIKTAQDTVDEDTKKKKKDHLKEMIDLDEEYFKDFVDRAIEAMKAVNEATQESITYRLAQQDTLISEQEVLASKGLKNDLGYEVTRRAELEKEQQKAIIQEKKIKELEIFLNSVSEFTKKDPKTAVPQALAVLAATAVASSKFAADGGMVEDLGISGRRHRNPEHLVRMEEGEGILNVNEVNNLGGASAFYKLKDNLNTPSFRVNTTMPNMMVSYKNDNTDVVEALSEVKKEIKNISTTYITADDVGTIVETRVRNGIKEMTKHLDKNRRSF